MPFTSKEESISSAAADAFGAADAQAVRRRRGVRVALADEVDNAHRRFSEIFVGGIPGLLNGDGAYLSFICVFAGTEALAGYRYANVTGNGERFRAFLAEYFEPRYAPLAQQLWELRNSMVHGFSPKHFALCHHQSHLHFTDQPPYVKVLNAEDVYAEFVRAAEKYFHQLRSDSAIQALFEQRLADPDGGSLYVASS
jgi:hypothetical protein